MQQSYNTVYHPAPKLRPSTSWVFVLVENEDENRSAKPRFDVEELTQVLAPSK